MIKYNACIILKMKKKTNVSSTIIIIVIFFFSLFLFSFLKSKHYLGHLILITESINNQVDHHDLRVRWYRTRASLSSGPPSRHKIIWREYYIKCTRYPRYVFISSFLIDYRTRHYIINVAEKSVSRVIVTYCITVIIITAYRVFFFVIGKKWGRGHTNSIFIVIIISIRTYL